VPKTCVTWADALQIVVGLVPRLRCRAGKSWSVGRWDDLRPVGLKLIFLVVSRAVPVLGLARREPWWKDAEILMLRRQLAVARRGRPRARSLLSWPDGAWLVLLAGPAVRRCTAACGLRCCGGRGRTGPGTAGGSTASLPDWASGRAVHGLADPQARRPDREQTAPDDRPARVRRLLQFPPAAPDPQASGTAAPAARRRHRPGPLPDSAA
jgi:hypothetical protein